MSILDGIKSKAMDLMGKASELATRSTGVYDASKNNIMIAGVMLDGVVSSTISDKQVSQQEQGLDHSYYTYYDVVTPQTLTVNILPTAKSNDVLFMLYERQERLKGHFNVYIYENGRLEGTYKGHIIALPEKTMQLEANDRTYVIGITTVITPVAIDQESSDEGQTDANEQAVQQQSTAQTYPVPEDQPITRTPLPLPN